MVKGTSFFSVLMGVLFGLWLVTLWFLSSLPGEDIELPSLPWSDKAAHFAYFFIGGVLLAWLLKRKLQWQKWRLIGAVFCAMAVIGALDELHQLYTKDRSGGDVADWIADSVGGALGGFVIGWIYARARERKPQASSGVVAEAD